MAGDENVDAVGAYGLSHSPYPLCVSDFQCNLHICPRFSVWDVEQCPPYLELEICSKGVQRNVKLLAAACKILVKLSLGLFNDWGSLFSEIFIHVSPNSA